jgi:hypothetical protein
MGWDWQDILGSEAKKIPVENGKRLNIGLDWKLSSFWRNNLTGKGYPFIPLTRELEKEILSHGTPKGVFSRKEQRWKNVRE